MKIKIIFARNFKNGECWINNIIYRKRVFN